MSTTTATKPHAAAQAEFRASPEYQAEVAGFAERTRLGLVGTAATEFVREVCEAADAARARIDAKHGIGAPQPATTRTEPSLQGLLALAHRCARLNPTAGAIGAGMLATIVAEARSALGWREAAAEAIEALGPWQEYDCPIQQTDMDLHDDQMVHHGQSFYCCHCGRNHVAGTEVTVNTHNSHGQFVELPANAQELQALRQGGAA